MLNANSEAKKLEEFEGANSQASPVQANHTKETQPQSNNVKQERKSIKYICTVIRNNSSKNNFNFQTNYIWHKKYRYYNIWENRINKSIIKRLKNGRVWSRKYICKNGYKKALLTWKKWYRKTRSNINTEFGNTRRSGFNSKSNSRYRRIKSHKGRITTFRI